MIRLLVSLLLSVAALAQRPTIAEISVASANRRLADNNTPAAEIRQILAERVATLRDLIKTDPARAIALALPESAANRIRRIAPDAVDLLETADEWDEPVQVVIHDDFANRTSRTHLTFRLNNESVELYLEGETPSLKCGDRIRARGIRLGNIIAAGVIHIDASVSPCTTIGDQKTAIILLNFPSSTLPANINASLMQSVYFAAGSHSQTNHWLESSYGLTSSSGQVFGPFTLSTDFTCSQTDQIRDAAIAAADGAVDFRAFNRIVMVLPQACGGIGSVGCDALTSPSKGSFNASLVWLGTDILASNDLGVCAAVHEGGHNLGLDHASSLQFGSEPLGSLGAAGTHSEYGDNYSLMGPCFAFNGTELLGHYAAQHKSILGWLPDPNIQTVLSNGTFTLLPYENSTSGVQALRVQRGLSTNLWLWLEYRQPVGYDGTYQPYTAQPYSGILAHYEDPSNSSFYGYTRLLDFTAAATPGNFKDPALAAGQGWSDPYSNLTLQVLSASPSGATVSVSYDTPCNSLTPGSRSYSASAVSDSVSVSTPGGCGWSAVSNAAWIAINGSNNSSVLYSLTANTGVTPRSSSISVGRQLFYITQASTNNPPTPVSISPQGSGTVAIAQTFTAVFSDLDGFANLTTVNVLFNTTQFSTAAACYVRYRRTGNSLSFYDDGGFSSSSGTPGANTVKSNTQCSLNYQLSSIVQSGNSVTLKLSLSFNSSFIGVRKIYMSAQDSAGADSGWVQIGTFEVKAATGAAYTISGQVTTGGAALSGTAVTLTGGPGGTRITDASGNYSFTGLPAGGNYTVTPTLVNYTFTPLSATFNNLQSNQSSSFAASPVTYTVSGGTGLAGVTITLVGGPGGMRTADASGNYSFTGLPAGGNYTLTPTRANYAFTPLSATFNNLQSNTTANFTGIAKPGTGLPDKVGTTYSGYSVLDANGNFAWDGTGSDKLISWSTFQASEKPIYGDWNGDGKMKVGVFNNGTWLLDYNGNGVWDGTTVDKAIFWSTGQSTDVPVLGDWNGDGKTKIGIYNNGAWILDYNGNGVWEGPSVDKTIYWSTGQVGEVPVTGDWNGDGKTKIGVHVNGTWILEYNGNYAWDGTAIDKLIFFGGAGYRPLVGDWNGSGWTKIGAYHVNGTWALDFNGNFVWDGTSIDKLTFFGGPEWTPVIGDWSGSGTAKIGAYTGGQWALDYNGNFAWDPPIDKLFSFGASGQTPIVGKW